MASERFGPTRRGGPVFRWLGERPAIDLANTVMVLADGTEVDLLTRTSDLARWLAPQRDRLPRVTSTTPVLEELRALRDAVRAVLIHAATGGKAPRSAIERVNSATGAAPVIERLVMNETGDLEARSVPVASDLLHAFLGALAMDAIELVTGEERERLHLCRAPSCGMVFLGARRWCCRGCGNRARVARHYQRSRS